jgi:hypothetical protein
VGDESSYVTVSSIGSYRESFTGVKLMNFDVSPGANVSVPLVGR